MIESQGPSRSAPWAALECRMPNCGRGENLRGHFVCVRKASVTTEGDGRVALSQSDRESSPGEISAKRTSGEYNASQTLHSAFCTLHFAFKSGEAATRPLALSPRPSIRRHPTPLHPKSRLRFRIPKFRFPHSEFFYKTP